MPEVLKNLEDHVSDVLEARRATQTGRFFARPESAEKVADVLNECFTHIAAEFEKDGFRFAKSGKKLSKRSDDFTYEISFQSDSGNLSGVHVGLAAHACVKSKKLAAWRTSLGLSGGGYVWVSQVGYMSKAHEYLKWQLVDVTSRHSEIQSLIETVRKLVIPAFAACKSAETLREQLLSRWELTSVPGWALEVALWLNHESAAERIIEVSIGAPKFNRTEFFASVLKLRTQGIGFPLRAETTASSLAAIVVHFDLNLPPSEQGP